MHKFDSSPLALARIVHFSERRRFVKALLAISAGIMLPELSVASAQLPSIMVSAFRHSDRQSFGVAVMNEQGKILKIVSLPGRGHASLYHKYHHQLLTFARRPGRFIQVNHFFKDQKTLEIASAKDRHFYGHGCFSASGTQLFATENNYRQAQGVIGIYDVNNGYKRLGEFSSYGVGPHDIRLLADGQTLLVANGGIETHPNTGREKLNLFEMQSNLALIDSRSGQLIKTIRLSPQYQQLSLRHLAINDAGECYVAGQYQGALEDMPPLVGTLTKAGTLALWDIPIAYLVQLKSYISAIQAIPNSPLVAITSARGGVVLVYNTQKNRVEQFVDIKDVSGVAGLGNTLVVSSGKGGIYQGYGHADGMQKLGDFAGQELLQWDNHLLALNGGSSGPF